MMTDDASSSSSPARPAGGRSHCPRVCACRREGTRVTTRATKLIDYAKNGKREETGSALRLHTKPQSHEATRSIARPSGSSQWAVKAFSHLRCSATPEIAPMSRGVSAEGTCAPT